MSIICFTADQHIKLGQKNVPADWQVNRFMLLAKQLNTVECDYHVFGGDLLDRANPTVQELGLMYDFLNAINKPIVLISGNHELQTKTRDCFVFLDQMMKDLGVTVIREFQTYDGVDYIPYNILHGSWEPSTPLAFTHVRGEIPPHVLPEVDLERFSPYDKVFAGDLHSYSNSQLNILYPGSPFSTSFHRNCPTGSNGLFLINTDSGSHVWVELVLPQLIRKTVKDAKDIIPTTYHHTIYELEGSLESLALVKDSELLDKKLTKDVTAPPTLNMSGVMAEELAEFLVRIRDIKEEEISTYVTLFTETLNDSS